MKTAAILSAACFFSSVAIAADKKKSGDVAELPEPVNMDLAKTMLESPPFTRTLNLSDSLVLTGVAYIDGKPVATILDRAKGKSYVVSDTPNAMGWKLADTSLTGPIKRTQARIYVGGEIITVRYSDQQTPSDDAKKRFGDRGPGGPPPPDGGPPRREYRGPSEEDRRRFEALSDKSKERLRDFFRDNREKLMNATPEERMQFIKSNFERIEKEDKGGGK